MALHDRATDIADHAVNAQTLLDRKSPSYAAEVCVEEDDAGNMACTLLKICSVRVQADP